MGSINTLDLKPIFNGFNDKYIIQLGMESYSLLSKYIIAVLVLTVITGLIIYFIARYDRIKLIIISVISVWILSAVSYWGINNVYLESSVRTRLKNDIGFSKKIEGEYHKKLQSMYVELGNIMDIPAIELYQVIIDEDNTDIPTDKSLEDIYKHMEKYVNSKNYSIERR